MEKQWTDSDEKKDKLKTKKNNKKINALQQCAT